VKTAISIPDDIFEAVERAAKRLGISRSELFTRAAAEFIGAQRDAEITRSYDRAFAEGHGDDDEFRREASRRALLEVEWSDE
jgi:hypothetical protein